MTQTVVFSNYYKEQEFLTKAFRKIGGAAASTRTGRIMSQKHKTRR